MIQSIDQSYDYKKKTKKEIDLKISQLSASKLPFAAEGFVATNTKDAIVEAKGGGGGGGTSVIPNPTGIPAAYLDTVQIGDTKYQVQQITHTPGNVNDVLVYKGGGGVDNEYVNPETLNVNHTPVADMYDPTKNQTTAYDSAYALNDKVIYQNKMYNCTTAVKSRAGEWNSDYWTQALEWNDQDTYTEGMKREYQGAMYECVVATATVGEFKDDEWNDVSASYEAYSETAVYNPSFSKVKYNGDFYTASASYKGTGGAGSFNALYWTETSVENELNNIFKSIALVPAGSSITTDANGYLRFTMTQTGTVKPLSLYGGNQQPNTGAYFELVASSYAGATGTLIVKVTDNEGALLKNETLTCYMSALLGLYYAGPGTITAVTQVVDQPQ